MTLVISRVGPADAVTRLGPADTVDLLAMHTRCTPQTRFARWHGHTSEFPRAYLASITAGDDTQLALAAWHDGRLIGFASAAVIGSGVREIGILVEDAWQHRGVGGQLIGALVDDMRRSGTTRLRAEVLAHDVALLTPLAQLGPVSTQTSHGLVTAEVDIRAE